MNEQHLALLMRNLKICFWSIFLGSTAIGIFLFYFAPYLVIDGTISIKIQSVAIACLLGFIPLGLWLYNKNVVSATLPQNVNRRIFVIFKWFAIRLILIDFALVFNMTVYALTKIDSLLYGVGIAFMILLFLCKPNEKETYQVLSK